MKDEYPPLVQSQLEITELEVKINCKNCDASSRLEEPIFICPECGSTEIDMIQGNELHIMSIEGESD